MCEADNPPTRSWGKRSRIFHYPNIDRLNIAARFAHALNELEVVSKGKYWHIFTTRAFASMETGNPRI